MIDGPWLTSWAAKPARNLGAELAAGAAVKVVHQEVTFYWSVIGRAGCRDGPQGPPSLVSLATTELNGWLDPLHLVSGGTERIPLRCGRNYYEARVRGIVHGTRNISKPAVRFAFPPQRLC